MPSNTLFYYMKQVERRAGHPVSSSFPSSPNDVQQTVLDSINERLRYLNSKYYFIFKQTEYTLTTTAGQMNYDLTQAPYSQEYFLVSRLARNGLVRVSDDWPLRPVDYTEFDLLKPNSAGNANPTHYTVFGNNIRIYPPGDGNQIYVRYYSGHIGTNSAGTTKKLRLEAEDDLTMLNDAWEDVLVYGAAMQSRAQKKTDEKYAQLKRVFDEWESILNDMGNQPGEDMPPQHVIAPYIYNNGVDMDRYYPFGTPYSGGA